MYMMPPPPQQQQQQQQQQRFGGAPAAPHGAHSRVMLLLEMVGPEEVHDPSLPGEVTDECSKYGPVEAVRVALRRSPATGAPEVGVFVAFRSYEGCAAGMAALDRRYFGGRITSARAYPEAAFYGGDLQQAVF